jgi:hypothetical protein
MGGFNGGHTVAPHFSGNTARFAGGHVYGGFAGGRAVTPSYAGHAYSGHSSAAFGRPAYSAARPGYGHAGYYGHARAGFVGGYGRHWGGGYWGGRFWPGCHYGANFAWFYPVLPFGFATYYWGATPYYYYNGGYYLWDPGYNGYVASDPPPVASTEEEGSTDTENSVVSNDAGTGGGVSDIYVYPRNGQSEEQTSNDRFECHKWAVSQTGFDPTRSQNPQGTADDYRRAMGACLDARGYTVK